LTAQISSDRYSELFSLIAENQGSCDSSKIGLVSERRALAERLLSRLSPVDYWTAYYYYLDGQSQAQVSSYLGVTQAAVSRRLKSIRSRLRSLLKMPTEDPIQVYNDLKELFPANLFEFAYFFYHEFAQNRVKHFINTSQAGAANKLERVIKHLEKVSEEGQKSAGEDEAPQVITNRQSLARSYLDYFRYTRDKSNIVTFLPKRNNAVRAGLLVGPALF
jgi:hypothetical protein